MGYGHQRAALPFKDIAQGGKIIAANDYVGIPSSDRNIWEASRRFYEAVSRFKKFPVLGDLFFAIYDKFQEIQEFYPTSESIEAPTLQLKQVYQLFEKKRWGKHLITQLNKNPLPLLCTFFIPAQMAEFWGYKGSIYVVIPDADISRAWVPLHPKQSKIIYCASTQRVAARLKRYGIKQERIIVTGFPLVQELTKKNVAQAKKDLRRRLDVLDPDRRYFKKYEKLIEQYVGKIPKKALRKSRVRLTFAIGGAGAQAEVAEQIAESVQPLLREGTLEFHIIAGVHTELAATLQKAVGKNVFVHSSSTKKKYFEDFSKILSKTDVLWTKPSELVFYAGLGVPIILAPSVGSQEVFNRRWLMGVGAGVAQKKPELTHQWLPDLLESGRLAKAAMQGFVEITRDGTENIKKLIFRG